MLSASASGSVVEHFFFFVMFNLCKNLRWVELSRRLDIKKHEFSIFIQIRRALKDTELLVYTEGVAGVTRYNELSDKQANELVDTNTYQCLLKPNFASFYFVSRAGTSLARARGASV